MDREKVIRIIDELIFEAQKAPTWKAENALRCLKKELLKEQEESIPVSWLTEKLEGHPELPYAVTDGITNVLYLWEGR